jgi:hypothetical protein
MRVGYRQDDAAWMVTQPCCACLSGREEMTVIAESTAPAIRN